MRKRIPRCHFFGTELSLLVRSHSQARLGMGPDSPGQLCPEEWQHGILLWSCDGIYGDHVTVFMVIMWQYLWWSCDGIYGDHYHNLPLRFMISSGTSIVGQLLSDESCSHVSVRWFQHVHGAHGIVVVVNMPNSSRWHWKYERQVHGLAIYNNAFLHSAHAPETNVPSYVIASSHIQVNQKFSLK